MAAAESLLPLGLPFSSDKDAVPLLLTGGDLDKKVVVQATDAFVRWVRLPLPLPLHAACRTQFLCRVFSCRGGAAVASAAASPPRRD